MTRPDYLNDFQDSTHKTWFSFFCSAWVHGRRMNHSDGKADYFPGSTQLAGPKRFSVAFPWLVVPFCVLVPSLVWIWFDHGSWRWDESDYADASVTLYALLGSPWEGWLDAMLTIDPVHTGGLMWFGQFFVGLHRVFGSIEHALLFYIFLLQIATIMVVYDTCRRLAGGNKFTGSACALAMAASPLFINLGHGYFVEPLQVLIVAWLWRLAVISPRISLLDLTISIALASLLGLDAKLSTPLFAVAPVLLAGLGVFGVLLPRPKVPWTRKWPTRVFLLTAFALLAGLTCARSVLTFESLVSYLKLPLTTSFWGTVDPFQIKLLKWLHIARISFLPGLVLYAALAATAVAVLFRIRRAGRFDSYGDLIPLGATTSLTLAIVVYSMAPNEDSRLALPMLPSLAVMLAWVLNKIPRSLVLVFCLCTAGYGLAVQAADMGMVHPSGKLYYPYEKPVHTDLTLSNELTSLVRFTSTPETDNLPQIVVVNYSWLCDNLLNFYAAKEKLLRGAYRPRYSGNGLFYGESDLNKALQVIDNCKPRFIIGVLEDKQPPPDFVNLVNLPLLAHVRADSRYEQVEFPSDLGIIVFQLCR